ncbi:MAG: hypothetical protein ACKVU2_17800 [Saprospiraceae bacterium]
MSANFDKLRLRYQRAAAAGEKAIDVILELTSLNVDVNQTTVGAGVPFTTEMSFKVKIDPENAVLPASATPYALTTAEGFRRFLHDVVFNDDPSLANNLHFEYMNMDTGGSLDPRARANLRHTNVALQSATGADSFSAYWLVHLKFSCSLFGGNSIVLYPQLGVGPEPNVKATSPALANANPQPDPLLAAFNAELKSNFEILFLQDSANITGNANALGKVADEIADSFANLGATIAGKLSSTLNTSLQPSREEATNDVALWYKIKLSTQDLSFDRFQGFMDHVFCGGAAPSFLDNEKLQKKTRKLSNSRGLPYMGVDAYRSIKVAAEAFVMVNCMTDDQFDDAEIAELEKQLPLVNGNPDAATIQKWWNAYKVRVNGAETGSTIPYLGTIKGKLEGVDLKTIVFEDALQQYIESSATTPSNCYGIIKEKLTNPCFLELIWSYWHEESMMVQGLNAIGRRFQNIKGPGASDPLTQLNIDPLRPLSNLLWGYLQDEPNRLTVRRRAYEYDHHYGITLQGTAVQNLRPADSRSKFIEGFHTLLNLAHKFFRQADDMTVKPDAFPILNALKEVHLVLSEGAHNQYGDLPSVSRAEMLMQQWMLARPEFREFLPTRVMVAYPEDWMPRVASLNNMMGWTQTSVLHFRDLGVFGEELLLSIRFGDWSRVIAREAAANWANFWRSEIQSYIHAYRAVTGVDLTAEITGGRIDAVQPSVHLQRRLLEQRGKVA